VDRHSQRGPAPRNVEEWQVSGILAALDDGYPEVRVFATKMLVDSMSGFNLGKRPYYRSRSWSESLRSRVKSVAISKLRNDLNSLNPQLRSLSVEALDLLEDRDSARRFVELLDDQDEWIGFQPLTLSGALRT
jgi:hypothetical protein